MEIPGQRSQASAIIEGSPLGAGEQTLPQLVLDLRTLLEHHEVLILSRKQRDNF